MTDSLYESIVSCSKELMKYGFTPEEFAALAQQHNMSGKEIPAISQTSEYLQEKKKSESVEFLLVLAAFHSKLQRILITSISSELPTVVRELLRE